MTVDYRAHRNDRSANAPSAGDTGAKPAAARESKSRFGFWSQSEVLRLGLIGSMAVFPLMTGAQSTADGVGDLRDPPAAHGATGGLRAVRVVPFDIRALSASALGDVERQD